MSVYLFQEAAIHERHANLANAMAEVLENPADMNLRTEYTRFAIMELESFALIVGVPRPVMLASSGQGGAFDEIVDLYTTRGAGISDYLYQHLTLSQHTVLDAYPKLSFDLGIEYDEEGVFNVSLVSVELPAGESNVYNIATGKLIDA